jgi:hypothetical protein
MIRGATAKAVVVHDLDQAMAALAIAAEVQRPVAIWSARRAALDLGIGWFAAVARLAHAAEPRAEAAFILDCGTRADLVQEAFREGLDEVCFTGRAAVAERLADIARKCRARLHMKRPRALDLDRKVDIQSALRTYLGSN